MSAPMNAVDLAKIRARWEAVTPGPWITRHSGGAREHCVITRNGFYTVAHVLSFDDPAADANAIAHAPEDVARLLEEVARLTRELAEERAKPRHIERMDVVGPGAVGIKLG